MIEDADGMTGGADGMIDDAEAKARKTEEGMVNKKDGINRSKGEI